MRMAVSMGTAIFFVIIHSIFATHGFFEEKYDYLQNSRRNRNHA